jgi:hypothetical protein
MGLFALVFFRLAAARLSLEERNMREFWRSQTRSIQQLRARVRASVHPFPHQTSSKDKGADQGINRWIGSVHELICYPTQIPTSESGEIKNGIYRHYAAAGYLFRNPLQTIICSIGVWHDFKLFSETIIAAVLPP